MNKLIYYILDMELYAVLTLLHFDRDAPFLMITAKKWPLGDFLHEKWPKGYFCFNGQFLNKCYELSSKIGMFMIDMLIVIQYQQKVFLNSYNFSDEMS